LFETYLNVLEGVFKEQSDYSHCSVSQASDALA